MCSKVENNANKKCLVGEGCGYLCLDTTYNLCSAYLTFVGYKDVSFIERPFLPIIMLVHFSEEAAVLESLWKHLCIKFPNMAKVRVIGSDLCSKMDKALDVVRQHNKDLFIAKCVDHGRGHVKQTCKDNGANEKATCVVQHES